MVCHAGVEFVIVELDRVEGSDNIDFGYDGAVPKEVVQLQGVVRESPFKGRGLFFGDVVGGIPGVSVAVFVVFVMDGAFHPFPEEELDVEMLLLDGDAGAECKG